MPTSAGAVMMVVYKVLSTLERDWVDQWMTYMLRLSKEAQGVFANGVRGKKYTKQAMVMQQQEVHAVGDGQQLSVYSRQVRRKHVST